MQKAMLLVLIVLAAGFTSAECSETDGGRNVETRGTGTGTYSGSTEQQIIEDSCYDSYQVLEAHCVDNHLSAERIDCMDYVDNGVCSEGACIANPLATARQCSEFGYNRQNGVINYCDDSMSSYDLSVCYQTTYSCTDSDNGEDYYTLGQTSVSSSSLQGPSCNPSRGGGGGGSGGSPLKDTCNGSMLRERICNQNGTSGYVEHYCENGCSNGVCGVSSPANSSIPGGGSGGGGALACLDTDGGIDYYEKGAAAGTYDSCISVHQLSERYCRNSTESAEYIAECPTGYVCEDGECVESAAETPIARYFKSCTYVWDASPYVGQTVKISASIKDSVGDADSDSAQVKVVEGYSGGGGSGHSMDGNSLDIQINEPGSDLIPAGFIEISISSAGPNMLADMTLGFIGQNWTDSFPISNRNCAAGGAGGSGSVETVSCDRYHTCKDGTEIQYCDMVEQHDQYGNIAQAACACQQNPEAMCQSHGSGSGGGVPREPTEIPTSVSSEVIVAETQLCSGCESADGCLPLGYRSRDKYCNDDNELIAQKNDGEGCENSYECDSNICERNICGKYCDGCIKDDNCIPYGTRLENKYCNLEKTMKEQQSKASNCSNNYECVSNVCLNSKCVEPSLMERIIKWFTRLFGS